MILVVFGTTKSENCVFICLCSQLAASSMLFCKFLQSFLLLRKSKEIIVR